MNVTELPPILENFENRKSSKANITGNIKDRRRFSYNSEINSKGNVKSSKSNVGSSGSGNSGHHRNSIISSEEILDTHVNRIKSWNTLDDSGKGNKIKLEPLMDTPRTVTGRTSVLSARDASVLLISKVDSKSKKLESLNKDKNDQFHTARAKTFVTRRHSDEKINYRNTLLGKRLISVHNLESLTKNKKVDISGLRRYSSALTLNIRNDINVNDNYFSDGDIVTNREDYDDDEKDSYIIEWLMGIESEDREIPPEPQIEYVENPPQKDTAIHIVYGEE